MEIAEPRILQAGATYEVIVEQEIVGKTMSLVSAVNFLSSFIYELRSSNGPTDAGPLGLS